MAAVDVQTTPVLLRRMRFNLAEYHLMVEPSVKLSVEESLGPILP